MFLSTNSLSIVYIFPENISLFPLISWFTLYLILQAFTNQNATKSHNYDNDLLLRQGTKKNFACPGSWYNNNFKNIDLMSLDQMMHFYSTCSRWPKLRWWHKWISRAKLSISLTHYFFFLGMTWIFWLTAILNLVTNFTGWNDKIIVLKKTTLQLYFKTFIEKITSAILIM